MTSFDLDARNGSPIGIGGGGLHRIIFQAEVILSYVSAIIYRDRDSHTHDAGAFLHVPPPIPREGAQDCLIAHLASVLLIVYKGTI